MARVRANNTCLITHNGVPVVISEGEEFDSDDPMVRDFKWLFNTGVEEATARPGERRNVTRKS